MLSLESALLLGKQLLAVLRTLNVKGIILAGHEIEVSDIVISRPMTFFGNPGTQLIIKSGSIDVKSSFYMKEVTIISKVSVNSSKPLFRVFGGAELKLQDCHAKVERFFDDDCDTPKEEKEDNKVCIKMIEDDLGKPASITLMSCSFIGFDNHITAVKGAILDIDKCGFHKPLKSAIVATNPSKVKIKESNFEKCLDSTIEVRWENSKLNTDEEIVIAIENNTIVRSGMNGILIDGEKLQKIKINAQIKVNNNQISKCKNDGICLKNIIGNTIEILNNTVSNNNSNGISVYSSYCNSIELVCDNCIENEFCGIYIKETLCTIKKGFIVKNKIHGVSIINNPKNDKNSYHSTDIFECNINENAKNGLYILNNNTRVINIINCKINNNNDYGVYLISSENLIVSTNQSYIENSLSRVNLINTAVYPIDYLFQSRVYLNMGEIQGNGRGGIYMNRQLTCISNVIIKNNGEFAVYIPAKNNRKEVSIIGDSKRLILGTIGGRWGKADDYINNHVCGCTSCNIF